MTDLFSQYPPPATGPHETAGASAAAARLPFQRHSETSHAAADRAVGRAEADRRRILDHLRRQGARGATDEEMQAALAVDPNSQRPRRIDLVDRGLVRASGQTRKTEKGHPATVWVAVPNPEGVS